MAYTHPQVPQGARRLPNLIRPATFNEKTLYRILFDRRLVLTRVADKAAVRSYVEARLGPQVLRTLYCLTIHPDTIPFDQLPDRFVVKPTHGCGWVQIVSDKSALNRGALIALCARWLNQSYYLEVGMRVVAGWMRWSRAGAWPRVKRP